MIEGRFSCLPVVDERGHLDGVLTATDLLHALATVLWSTDDRIMERADEHLVASRKEATTGE